jgi:hypothetical protein
MITNTELKFFCFNCFEEGKNINTIEKEDLKFLIDKSIIKLFGILEASKILYNIEFDKNLFKIKTYNK